MSIKFASLHDIISLIPVNQENDYRTVVKLLVIDIESFHHDVSQYQQSLFGHSSKDDMSLQTLVQLNSVDVIIIQSVEKLMGYLTLMEMGKIPLKVDENLRVEKEEHFFDDLNPDDDIIFKKVSVKIIIWNLFNNICDFASKLYSLEGPVELSSFSCIHPSRFGVKIINELIMRILLVNELLKTEVTREFGLEISEEIQIFEDPNIAHQWKLIPVPLFNVEENHNTEMMDNTGNTRVGKGYKSVSNLYQHLISSARGERDMNKAQPAVVSQGLKDSCFFDIRQEADTWFYKENLKKGMNTKYIYLDSLINKWLSY